MKMPVSFLVCAATLALVLSLAAALTGCEEAKGLDGLTVSYSADSVSQPGDTVVLQVVGEEVQNTTDEETEENTTIYEYKELALPFEWSVEDGSLGGILVAGQGIAVYTATSVRGPNVVTVKDQYDNVGRVVIRVAAPDYAISLTALPSTTIDVGEAATISFTSTDAVAPFIWRLTSGPGSLTGGTGSRSAVYTSNVAGTGVIQVTDARGVQGTIAIVVEDADGGGAGGDGGAGGT